MKFKFIFLFFLLSPFVTLAVDKNLEINGLIIDETLSQAGHFFYEELIKEIDTNKQHKTITVHERFDPFSGNVIWIDINEDIVFQDRIGMRIIAIEDKIKFAVDMINSYLQQHKDIY